MSDSEYASSIEDVAPLEVVPPPRSSKSKSKTSASTSTASTPAPKPRKRKPAAHSVANVEALTRPKKTKSLFSIINKDERASAKETTRSIASSFTSRVSSGQCRRTAVTSGEFYIDLKVYNTDDVKNVPPEERYKKALAAVKLQCGEQSQEWEALQRFISSAYVIFEECEPTYYSNKINIK
ncbi:uncharacterized protein LOC135088509 [Ostrinia nubilalis]|uniref:uncharacterized protein LOC135072877 n=1 Tax=Ostrinia nubilalis TaxID=29057 RepID=UPI0030822360